MTTSSSKSLPRTWLLAARVVWLVFAVLAFAVFFLSLAQFTGQTAWVDCPTAESGCQLNVLTNADQALMAESGAPVQLIIGFIIVSSIAARLILAGVGVTIFLLRPSDRIAWLMSLVLLTVLTEGISQLGQLQILVDVVFAVGVVGWMPLPFIFPNGHIEPRWLKWPVVVLSLIIAPFWLPALAPVLPVGLFALVNISTLMWSLLGIYSMIYRYRNVSTPLERQQLKWVLAGFVGVFFTALTYTYLQAVFPPWQPSTGRIVALILNGVGYVVGYGLFAASLLFAILRYRLWDIDVVIRRTLLYSLLTVTLALIYFGAVIVLQPIFNGLTGQNSLAIIGSTLLIAALFQPLRRRLQRVIDRRFYRRKYDASRALAGFAVAARDDIDLNGVTTGLLAVVNDTMEPASSGVWLRPLGEPPPPASR